METLRKVEKFSGLLEEPESVTQLNQLATTGIFTAFLGTAESFPPVDGSGARLLCCKQI
jgi:hypothetical protein